MRFPAFASSLRAMLLMTALTLVGCVSPPDPPTDHRPDVVLVTIDTLRADHCSAYGYAKPTTPRLEQLARDGTYFAAATSPMPTTGPAHLSMFSGVFPRSHGLVRNGIPVPASSRTLTEVLAGRGYQTAAFVSSFVLAARFGFQRGFETYSDDFARIRSGLRGDDGDGTSASENLGRRADETTRQAVAWLQQRRSATTSPDGSAPAARPFFLWVHYFDPHDPYDPPEAFRRRFAAPEGASRLDQDKGAYDGEIAFADSQLAVLLDALARRSDKRELLVMVAGDHGEALMDHGHMHHGLQLYEESVHVPWITWWPGHVPAGRKVASAVTTVDLMPTMLGLLGESAPAGVQGRSLAPLIASDSGAEAASPVILQRRYYQSPNIEGTVVSGEKYGIRISRWKYLEAAKEGTRELYDLDADPREQHNIAADNSERTTELAARLHAWLDATPQAKVETQTVAPDTEERLKSLGYLP